MEEKIGTTITNLPITEEDRATLFDRCTTFLNSNEYKEYEWNGNPRIKTRVLVILHAGLVSMGLKYIVGNKGNKITVKQLAEVIGCSKTTLKTNEIHRDAILDLFNIQFPYIESDDDEK